MLQEYERHRFPLWMDLKVQLLILEDSQAKLSPIQLYLAL
jgi:hypothetical protein